MSKQYWLIWSIEHSRWWAPASQGYVFTKEEAGRYEWTEALEIVRNANRYLRGNVPNEALVPAE